MSWNKPLASLLSTWSLVQPTSTAHLMPASHKRSTKLWSSKIEYEMAHDLEQIRTEWHVEISTVRQRTRAQGCGNPEKRYQTLERGSQEKFPGKMTPDESWKTSRNQLGDGWKESRTSQRPEHLKTWRWKGVLAILDAWGWCTGTYGEGGGFRIGNTCIPVADSCWYMEKTIQYCKVKK